MFLSRALCPAFSTIFNLEFSSNMQGYIEYKTSIPIILNIQENIIMFGDLNQDSIINVIDIISLVNMIIGN